MLIKKPSDIKSSEITGKEHYLNRRQFLLNASVTATAVAAGFALPAIAAESGKAEARTKLQGVRKSPFSTDEKQTPVKDITHYNNFYEFGTDKYSPARFAKSLITRPWAVAVEGEVKREKVYDIDELMKRDKVSLDLFWLKDESLEDGDSLPDPEVLATEIADDRPAAMEQFAAIAGDLGQEP